ncbi:3761_t:CDS:2, partial [Racocetra fulgida]
TKFSSYLLDNGNERKTFICRLSKPKESSGRKENILSEKLRVIWKRLSNNCEARIRITWLVASNMVRIERAIKDYKPPMIANVIRKEVSKLYEDSGVEYLKTKEVVNIKQKLVGLMNSHLIEDVDLKSDILSATEFLLKNNFQ